MQYISIKKPLLYICMTTLGKSRKHTLGSLFKRSTDDSGSRSSKSERGSSRSKKKSSREAKGGSRDSLDKSVSLDNAAATISFSV